ncbi:hypothetical protein CVT25_004044 [Psilocybe cyanescens]|uniref:Secreted protein n=1 Tax=Psilocybe cyanescens TaxID=93625 RepID=A0A409WXS3_PSICY|nr:hypothetical protein CVT25_004044 [Psilocybe cyanescens]
MVFLPLQMRLYSVVILCVWALQIVAVPIETTRDEQNSKAPKTIQLRNREEVAKTHRASRNVALGTASGKTAHKEKPKRPSPKTLGHGPLVQQSQAHAAMLRYHREKQQRKGQSVIGKVFSGATKIFRPQHSVGKEKTNA